MWCITDLKQVSSLICIVYEGRPVADWKVGNQSYGLENGQQ